MAEVVIIFILMSWLLVTLIIWWFKHHINIKEDNDCDDELDEILEKMKKMK